MQIRFQFRKGEDLKFIGHLDILRLFERAFKRSALPVAHSQGFNPRPRIVFAQPMPLGLTSDGEFADVELLASMSAVDFMTLMNASLPPGIQLVDAKVKSSPSNPMGLVSGARYRIGFDVPVSFDIHTVARKVLDSTIIHVMKKTKSGLKQIDIRPLIYEVTGDVSGTMGYFNVLLGAGQNDNVRPELFLSGVSGICCEELELRSMHRIILLGYNNGRWLSLLDEQFL